MNMTTTGDLSPQETIANNTMFLEETKANLVFQPYGVPAQLSQHNGLKLVWVKYHNFPRPEGPVSEGVTPPAIKPQRSLISVDLKPYVQVVEMTETLIKTTKDPLMAIMRDKAAISAAETLDYICFCTCRAGTNVLHAGTATTRETVEGVAVFADFALAEQKLLENNVRRITKRIRASQDWATVPVGESYIAITSPMLKADIQAVETFVGVTKYANPSAALKGEIGMWNDSIRFLTSTQVEPWLAAGASGTTMRSNGVKPSSSAAADVWPILIFGEEAYGVCSLTGQRQAQIIVHNPRPDSADPTGSLCHVSWKALWACRILNQRNLVRLEVALACTPATPKVSVTVT